VQADTLPELARALGLDETTFMQTLADYNAACRVGTFDHTVLDDCHTEGLAPPKTHWARPIDTPPFYGYALRPGITFTYLGLKTDETAAVRFGGVPSDNLFVAGEMMAGNVLGKGYTAGVGMSIGTAFGRIAGTQAARAALKEAAMQSLDALAREAVALAWRKRHPGGATTEVGAADADLQCLPLLRDLLRRVPGHDAPARIRQGDIHYLANLCHNCGACLHACQYAPPHEFAVNVPRAMAQVRQATYTDYAWPPALGALYRRNGVVLALATAGGAGAVPGAGAGDARHAAARAAGRQLLRRVPAQPAGRAVRRGVRLRGAGAGHRRGALLARPVAGPGDRRAGAEKPRTTRFASSTWMAATTTAATRRRPLHAGAAALPPPDLLRLPAVLRVHLRGDAVPLRRARPRALPLSPACRCCWARSAASACWSARPACCG
jgi:hypothetical protein